MQHFMKRFANAYKDFGLEINLKKTVVIHDPVPGLPYKEASIYIERKKLDAEHSFVYLCSTLVEDFDNEIPLLIEKSARSFSSKDKSV